MGDRYNIHSQLEHLQSKYIGTGHSDTNKWEWLTNQHRDSYASYMGHFDVLNFFAIAENESKARIRFNLMERMLQPCGPPPERPEDWAASEDWTVEPALKTERLSRLWGLSLLDSSIVNSEVRGRQDVEYWQFIIVKSLIVK